jgi:hypothetical protein
MTVLSDDGYARLLVKRTMYLRIGWIASDLDENTLAVKEGHGAPAKGNIDYGE